MRQPYVVYRARSRVLRSVLSLWLSSLTLLRVLLDGWQARRACCSFLLGLWWLLRLEPICTVSNNAEEGRRLLLGAFLDGEALKNEVVTVRLPQIYLVALPKRICLLADLLGVATARNLSAEHGLSLLLARVLLLRLLLGELSVRRRS